MSSFNMHIAIAKKIKDEFLFGDEFVLGVVLPDLYKTILKDKTITHFERKIGEEYLPDIEKFCSEYKNKKTEIVYGYLAHLVQDTIWFSQYNKKKYVKEIENGKFYKYIKDNTIHKVQEYVTNIYTDYTIIDKYLEEKYKLNTKEINKKLKETVIKSENIKEKEEVINAINKTIIDYSYKYNINEPITFFTKEDADEYYKVSLEETRKVLIDFMKNKKISNI